MLVGEVVPSIPVVRIVLSDGCLYGEGCRQRRPSDDMEGDTYPLSIRKIRAPFFPMDFLLAIGLEAISLGTTVLVSEVSYQTITIRDSVATFRGIVGDLDAFGRPGCLQRLYRFCLKGIGRNVDGETARFGGIQRTDITTRFTPEKFPLDALCRRHRSREKRRGKGQEASWENNRG